MVEQVFVGFLLMFIQKNDMLYISSIKFCTKQFRVSSQSQAFTLFHYTKQQQTPVTTHALSLLYNSLQTGTHTVNKL